MRVEPGKGGMSRKTFRLVLSHRRFKVVIRGKGGGHKLGAHQCLTIAFLGTREMPVLRKLWRHNAGSLGSDATGMTGVIKSD